MNSACLWCFVLHSLFFVATGPSLSALEFMFWQKCAGIGNKHKAIKPWIRHGRTYTVRPCLIHTCHAMPMPCSDHAVLLKATAQHGRAVVALRRTAWSEHGMGMAWHSMASVNQTRPHCVNQMGKTHSKHLAARHGSGTAWERHGNGMLCVNRPLGCPGAGTVPKDRGHQKCFGDLDLEIIALVSSHRVLSGGL